MTIVRHVAGEIDDVMASWHAQPTMYRVACVDSCEKMKGVVDSRVRSDLPSYANDSFRGAILTCQK